MFNSNNSNNQNKPPAYPLSQPPPQQSNEWNINDMPWKSSGESSSSVMLFNGLVPPAPASSPSTSGFFSNKPRVKRKSESDDISDDFTPPNKQYVSEEKMIAHLNGLHLSDNFQSHKINEEEEESESTKMESYSVNLTPQELERRLRQAQRITVCDQVIKSMREDNEIIPHALLNRIEEPCRALVLWRPPDALERLLVGYPRDYDSRSDDEEEVDMDANNNNNNNDPNNNMDMDL